jgi:hypothetical protein
MALSQRKWRPLATHYWRIDGPRMTTVKNDSWTRHSPRGGQRNRTVAFATPRQLRVGGPRLVEVSLLFALWLQESAWIAPFLNLIPAPS